MRPPNTRNWKGEKPSKPLIIEATPSALSSLLGYADQYVLDVAISPYAGCARVFDAMSDPDRAVRYLGVMVAPGASHARAVLGYACPFGHVVQPANPETWSQTGGTSGANVILPHPPAPFEVATPSIFPFVLPIILGETGDTVKDVPTAAMDRQYELQTLAYPYVEPMMVKWTLAFSVWVSGQISNLEDL